MDDWQTQNVAGLFGGILAAICAAAAGWQTYQSKKVAIRQLDIAARKAEAEVESANESRLVLRRREVSEEWREFASNAVAQVKEEVEELKEENKKLRADNLECSKTSSRQDQELIHLRATVTEMRDALRNQGLKMPKLKELKSDESGQDLRVTS